MYYYLFILAIGIERLIELAVSRRNAKWSIAQGGRESAAITTRRWSACMRCCWFRASSKFGPWAGRHPLAGMPMIAVVALSTVVRWRCVAVSASTGTHGSSSSRARRWFDADRPMVTPPQLRRGHREVAALPLVHSAWLTAIVFSIANALVLRARIRAENTALGYA